MFEKILVPLDGSETAEAVLEPLGALLASAESGTVTLLRVVPADEGGRPTGGWEEAEDYLRRVRTRLAERSLPAEVRVEPGDPAERVVAAAERDGVDLVAMTSHGRSGLDRLVRGSVAERVLRTVSAPLLLTTPRAPTTGFRRILVPLDGSARAKAILPYASFVATHHGSEVVLFEVENYEGPEGSTRALLRDPAAVAATLEPVAAELRAQGVAAVRTAAEIGAPAGEILAAAEREEADLIAMTSHGRRGLARWWFGSTAEAVLRHARHPLLVVRAA